VLIYWLREDGLPCQTQSWCGCNYRFEALILPILTITRFEALVPAHPENYQCTLIAVDAIYGRYVVH
jgi:hypothetical protein